MTLAATTSLLTAMPDAALAGPLDGDPTITATQLPGPYVGAPTFTVDISTAQGLLYRFLLRLDVSAPPGPQEVVRWVKEHDPRQPGSGQTCVNVWNNYCIPDPDDLG